MSARDFQADFLLPALKGLNKKAAGRVAIALDVAIVFGVLEYVDGNPSLRDLEALRKAYDEKVKRLGAAGR